MASWGERCWASGVGWLGLARSKLGERAHPIMVSWGEWRGRVRVRVRVSHSTYSHST